MRIALSRWVPGAWWFQIPMRGNEYARPVFGFQPNQEFQIPMRGNERISSSMSQSSVPEFQIPMRGNEIESVRQATARHESSRSP